MSVIEEAAPSRASGPPVPRQLVVTRTPSDRAYRGVARGVALATLVILFLIGLFLLLGGLPAFRSQGLGFFTTTSFITTGKGTLHYGVAAALFGTVVISLIALVLATPVAVATALCITEYAPPRLKAFLRGFIDLLAAIPSVLFGLWGLYYLQPRIVGTARWLSVHMSWIPGPLFKVSTPIFTSSAFIAGIIVGLMILPIITSITREVFSLAPAGEREGAMALGATRWDVIRSVVLPFGRGGMTGAIMLGLGRALGETIAITLIISPVYVINSHILQAGSNSVASLIVVHFGSGGKVGLAAELAAGFTLFMFTLVVNLIASYIVRRSRSASGVEL